MKREKGLFFGALILVLMFVMFLSFGSTTAIAGQKVYRMKIQSA